MEALLGVLGPFGAPISFIGFILFMYAYFQKQNAQVMTSMQGALDRQNAEIAEYVKSSKEKNDLIEQLRVEKAELIMKNAELFGELNALKLKGK